MLSTQRVSEHLGLGSDRIFSLSSIRITIPLKTSSPSCLPPRHCLISHPASSQPLGAVPDGIRSTADPSLLGLPSPTVPLPCAPSVPAGPAAVCSCFSPWESRGPQRQPLSKSTCPTQVSSVATSGSFPGRPRGFGGSSIPLWIAVGAWAGGLVFLDFGCVPLLSVGPQQRCSWLCGK